MEIWIIPLKPLSPFQETDSAFHWSVLGKGQIVKLSKRNMFNRKKKCKTVSPPYLNRTSADPVRIPFHVKAGRGSR